MEQILPEYSIEIHCIGVTCFRDVTLYVCPFELSGHRSSRALFTRKETFSDFNEALRAFEGMGHKRRFNTMAVPEYGEIAIRKVALVGRIHGLTWRTLMEI